MKKFFRIAAALSLTGLLLSGCSAGGSSDKNLTPLVLNEVAHSIFYAPQYAAIELGYFEEEGIDLTLVNGGGADKVMTALISGDAQIGFMGSEASIYVYQEGSQNYAVNFAQLTQRAGNFLVGREPEPDFTWENLRGKKVLGGRAAGMPQMVFEYILKKHGLDPKTCPSTRASISVSPPRHLPAATRTTPLNLSPSPPPWSWKAADTWSLPWEPNPATCPTPLTVREKAIWKKIRSSFKNLQTPSSEALIM